MRKLSRGAYEDTKGFVRLVETLLEVLILTVLYYIIWRNSYPDGGFLYKGKYVLMGVYAMLMLVFFQNSDCTLFGQLRKADLMIGQVIALLLVNFVTYFQLCLIANRMLSPGPMILVFVLEIFVALLLVIGFTAIYRKLYAPHNMLLVYGNDQGIGLKIKMDSRQDKYKITKLMSADAGYEAVCQEAQKFDAVILNDIPAQLRNDILKFCYLKRIRAYVAPKLTDVILRGAKDNNLFDTPLLLVRGTGLTPTQRIAKRTMDIVLCAIAMVFAAPVMLVVAAAIKLEDGGPVFYKQKRLTRNGVEFEILKFRSMIVDAEKYAGAVLAAGNDPRITKVGKIIRATRLDELPQILNILKGDMSIVGPRPERKCFAEAYYEDMPEFAYRLKVRGGLTGYAQIYGKYNTSAYDKLRLDMMYIENYSLLLDIKLIILTLRIIFSKDSTEGVDVAEENQRKAEELLQQIHNTENPKE
ncbi:MAG: exopolysaccharide biosynthesis polyprenyl glycosylphosphotransferase [Oscillospiraceae bacterium]|nr:exopolysaccharide biosynthesis polyprenyl glycosylphosphotransferase [Oscillospiraceae bacterium]